MRNKLFATRMVAIMIAFALLSAVVPFSVANAAPSAPSGWCNGGIAWQIKANETAIDPGCGSGMIAVDLGKGLGADQLPRKATFAEAQALRSSSEGTYWFEPSQAAVPAKEAATPAAPAADDGANAGDTIAIIAVAPLSKEDLAAVNNTDWEQWLSGASPIVFSNGRGTINVGGVSATGLGTLGRIDVKNMNGVIVVLEPWRSGCGSTLATGGNQAEDPDCNPGAAWLFTEWSNDAKTGAVDWLQANGWPEGTLWFRPNDTAVNGTKTCVAALVPPGTALNHVPGKSFCPEGFSDPQWVLDAMGAGQTINITADVEKQLATRISNLEREVDGYRSRLKTFCADANNAKLAICFDQNQ